MTPKDGLPPHAWVSSIDASPYDAGTAWVTFDRHTFGEMGSWVFRASPR